MPSTLGDYVVFVDESGDHSLTPTNAEYPIFVLAVVAFKLDVYLKEFLPSLHRLKFMFFGNDSVVLHEREIRRRLGHFGGQFGSELRASLIAALTELLASANFRIIHVVIDKTDLDLDGTSAPSIYHLALQGAMQKLHEFLQAEGCSNRPVSVLFESRGRTEDSELAAEFERLRQVSSGIVDLRFHSVEKRANLAGLQVADLVARPIGMKYLYPDQQNRAFETLRAKLV